jgi:hypothetical protein
MSIVCEMPEDPLRNHVPRKVQLVLSVLLQELWNDDTAQEVTGSLRVVHQYVDMPSQQAEYFDPISRTSRPVSIECCSSKKCYRFIHCRQDTGNVSQ